MPAAGEFPGPSEAGPSPAGAMAAAMMRTAGKEMLKDLQKSSWSERTSEKKLDLGMFLRSPVVISTKVSIIYQSKLECLLVKFHLLLVKSPRFGRSNWSNLKFWQMKAHFLLITKKNLFKFLPIKHHKTPPLACPKRFANWSRWVSESLCRRPSLGCGPWVVNPWSHAQGGRKFPAKNSCL